MFISYNTRITWIESSSFIILQPVSEFCVFRFSVIVIFHDIIVIVWHMHTNWMQSTYDSCPSLLDLTVCIVTKPILSYCNGYSVVINSHSILDIKSIGVGRVDSTFTDIPIIVLHPCQNIIPYTQNSRTRKFRNSLYTKTNTIPITNIGKKGGNQVLLEWQP